MGAKVTKIRAAENYETLADERKNKKSRSKICMDRCTTRLCRPLRILQFLTTLLLFAMIVYMIASPYLVLTHLASILMVILTSSYLFAMAIEIMTQFESHGLPDSPMFLFSFLGIVLFAAAGGLLVHYKAVDDDFWALRLAIILCFVISLLYLIELAILIAYWKHKCMNWTKCYPYIPAGDCGQREFKMLFTGNCKQPIDIEVGRCDLTTSISHCAIALDASIDTAVAQHGCRKINVAHRRQYVDCHSSVPALSVVQIAEIQTECESTAITECQTQITETREILVQTNSRCELCNRQIEERPLSPTKLSSPPPSLESQSIYSPSPILSQTHSQLPLTIEPTPCNSSTPIKPEIKTQRAHCAICPAYLHMMREEISSPCCQSCNCGATEQQRLTTPYLLDQTSQRRDSDVQLPHWSQQDNQRTPRSTTSTLKHTESESPTTTNEKSDAERSDIAIEEGSRYRHCRKISRSPETRPCPIYNAERASRNIGLPETKEKLSSICTRRNKRTQMPKKHDSSISRDKDIIKVKEERISEKNIEEETSESYKIMGEKRERFEKIRDRSKSDETIDKTSEDRVKLMGDMEIRKRLTDARKSPYGSPRKLYRSSEITPPLTDDQPLTSITSEFSERDVIAARATTISRKQDSSGRVSRKTERTDSRESDKIGRVDSWLGDELPIKEEPDEEMDAPKSRTKFRKSIDRDEKSSILTSGREKKMSHSADRIDPEESTFAAGGPVLRLRLDKSLDDTKIITMERSEEAMSRANITESRTTVRSRSRGLPSIVGSEISIERPKSENEKIYRSSELREPSISRQSSIRSYRDTCQCHVDEEDKSARNEQVPTRLRDEADVSEYVSSDNENEEIIEKSVLSVRKDISTSSRVTRTKSIVRKERGEMIDE